jgi:hypothetical protein
VASTDAAERHVGLRAAALAVVAAKRAAALRGVSSRESFEVPDVYAMV